MTEKELIQELEEPVQQPQSVEFEEETTKEQQPQTVGNVETAAAPAANMLQFGQLITNTYCSISDFVYKKIKKTPTAPEWQEEEKQGLKQAFENYLGTLNVPMSPLMQLVATLATCEVVRYTIKPIAPVAQTTDNQ